MTASKAPEAAPLGRDARSVVDEARRSVADGPPEELDWTCEADKRLGKMPVNFCAPRTERVLVAE